MVSRSDNSYRITNKMRYLKLYELALQKSFLDWLKDPSQKDKVKYVVSSSARKRYKLSSLNVSLVELDKLTKKMCGISILDSIETDMDLNRDSILANEREIYQAWVEQEWGGEKNQERFLNTYGLDFVEYEFSIEDSKNVSIGLDTAQLAKKFDSRSFGENFGINSIKFLSIKDGKLDISLVSTKQLDEDDKGSVKDFITEQLSDGWGKIYSQKKQREKIGKLMFETSIEFYWHSGYPTWDITMD